MLTLEQEKTMLIALLEAKKAVQAEEIPIGAVLTYKGTVIAKAHNRVIASHDPTAHAEIVVLRNAAQIIGNYRLLDCALYVTLEPCPMCWFAILEARINKLYFGAYRDKQKGFCKSNNKIIACGGILAQESLELLQSFFQLKRTKLHAKDKTLVGQYSKEG